VIHSYDATPEKHLLDVVVYAETMELVGRILQLANKKKVPVFPRGTGTGFTEGTQPVHGDSLSIIRM
jgi:glycolate oxidase